MLVFTRKVDEIVTIGDDVQVLVVDIGPGKVRLGISAPRRVPVYRREIYERIQREIQDGEAPSLSYAVSVVENPSVPLIERGGRDEHADVVEGEEDHSSRPPAAPVSMLVLTRHRHEAIMIGDDVEVAVVDIQCEMRGGGQSSRVRLGITAPASTRVDRK